MAKAVKRKARGLGSARGSAAPRKGGMSALIASMSQKGTRTGDQELLKIDITAIEPNPFQPRKIFDEGALQKLADSILSNGIIQPITVRKAKGRSAKQRYQIVAGERRWRAATKAGMTTIPAIIKQVSDQESAMLAMIENLQREELNPIEEAYAYKRLTTEHAFTHEEVAKVIGKSRSAISNSLRLLNLTKEVQQMVASGLLDNGHARSLITLPLTMQLRLAGEIVKKNLSARDAERLAKQALEKTPASKNKKASSTEKQRLEQALSSALNTKVVITHNNNYKGVVAIHFSSNDSFVALLKRLGLKQRL